MLAISTIHTPDLPAGAGSAPPALEALRARIAAELDAERLGLGLLVFIEIAIDRTSEDAFGQFRAAMIGIPEVQECHMVAGGFDYLLKVRVRDMAAYRQFLGDVLSRVPGIRETRSCAVVERVKEARAIDLAHLRGR